MCTSENFKKLLGLIDSFIAGYISPSEFEKKYIAAWRSYRDFDDFSKIHENYKIYFDRVFTTLDVYCPDPELRDENDLDDEGLLSEVINLRNSFKGNNL